MDDPSRKSILLVRNTGEWVQVDHYKNELEDAGYRCTFSYTLTQEPVEGEFDLLLLCGVSDNIEQARAAVTLVEHLYPRLPIVLVTGHKDPDNIAYFATPRTVVLSRPFEGRELMAKVKQALSMGRL